MKWFFIDGGILILVAASAVMLALAKKTKVTDPKKAANRLLDESNIIPE